MLIQILIITLKSIYFFFLYFKFIFFKTLFIYIFRNVHFSTDKLKSTMNIHLPDDLKELPSSDTVDFSTTINDLLLANSDETNEYVATIRSPEHSEQLSKGLSKTKKIGLIFKLASVRGAKSKSMKHKLTTQFQPHTFKSVICDKNCDICQKSLINKKAVECKSKCYRFYLNNKFEIIKNFN